MFEKIKNVFKKKSTKTTAEQMQDSPEPWVNVVKCDLDPKDPKQGFFELEWNPAFVKHLIASGYYGPSPEEIVDQWFTDLCNNIALDGREKDNIVADGNRTRTNERTRKQSS